jgi:hypothetical protein
VYGEDQLSCAGLPLAVAKAILAENPAAIIKAVEDAINAVLGFVMPNCKDMQTLNKLRLIKREFTGMADVLFCFVVLWLKLCLCLSCVRMM